MNLATILADSAAQVDRAKPVDANWQAPNPEWFEQFTDSVLRQVSVALENDVREIEHLRRERDVLVDYLKGISRQTMSMVEAHS